jgi:dipeptidyl aminopeptidase/acylaminoacyl peptidase
LIIIAVGAVVGTVPLGAQRTGLQSADLMKLKSVGDVQLSRDGRRIAYRVSMNDRPGRPYSQVWIMDRQTRENRRLGSDTEPASGPRWSPDGQSIAYFGRTPEGAGLVVARADGSGATFLVEISGTNHPLPSSGEDVAWSPDGRRIAFISSTPGPEADESALPGFKADPNGDPMVITRYLYKPTASEGLTRFNDNRRLHIFIVDVATKKVAPLTTGTFYEHSIDWSPKGDEILFVSNREPDPDRFFNYDVFAVKVADGSIRRITNTKSAEYSPQWSPDGRTIAFSGTTRPLTSSETTMEDTHVWVMNTDGGGRRELGASIDNRQGAPGWSPDGTHVYATVQERGETHLYRFSTAGGSPERVVGEKGSVGAWSLALGDDVAYGFTTPASPAELHLKRQGAGTAETLTSYNKDLLASRQIAEVEPFGFKSFDGTEIEAFLTKPLELSGRPAAKYPLIVMIHGGPHGQQGPAFTAKSQVYAARGFASLMVNYRGSTGYGQKLADAIFKDQDGGEARDVITGVDAALAKYPWIDANRLGIEGGSYGGQLTNWIITQTARFKAAIPSAGISNLVSFNYMAYYHDYLAVEYGAFPHEQGIIDQLWDRSPIRYANKVRTPTMFIHGENDNDVPIAEAEQYFIALKDVGVETIMVRYPREGHGVRETKHVIDVIDRSVAWYKKHFDHTVGRTEEKPR